MSTISTLLLFYCCWQATSSSEIPILEQLPSTTTTTTIDNTCDPEVNLCHAAEYNGDQNPVSLRPKPRENETGSCLMFGICDETSGLPCKNETSPENYTDLVSRFCQDVLVENNEQLPLCCDRNQMQVLTRLLYMPESLLSKCPACFTNLRRLLCLMTCSTEQSQWMEVVDMSEGPDATAVSKVKVYVSIEYAEEVFDSCKDVQLVVTGRPMTDHICGRPAENSSTCTAEKWFKWIGNPQNELTNVELDFQFEAVPGTNKTLFTDKTTECGGPGNDTCSREDCPDGEFATTPTSESSKVPSTEEPSPSGGHVIWHHTVSPIFIFSILYLIHCQCHQIVRSCFPFAHPPLRT